MGIEWNTNTQNEQLHLHDMEGELFNPDLVFLRTPQIASHRLLCSGIFIPGWVRHYLLLVVV